MATAPEKLRFGPYVTPVTVPGTIVECEVRGCVTVVGTSKAKIPWPLGERGGEKQLIIFKALARALRHERPEAIADAWGVRLDYVLDWQTACHAPRKRKKQTQASQPIHWKPSDDELICRLTLEEAARLTGRTVTAVRKRRRALGVPDARFAIHKPQTPELTEQAELAARSLRARTDELRNSLAQLHSTCRQAEATVAFWRSCQIQAANAKPPGRWPA